jgi:putative copper export protein/methionine-rich copper-binding protein CopC
MAVLAAIVGAFVGLLFTASMSTPAAAATELVESSPADGAEVPPTLTSITLRFDATIAGQPQVTISCENNPFTGTGAATVSGDTLTVPLTSALPEGSCNVVWRLNDTNGNAVGTGDFGFDVAASAAAADATADSSADTAGDSSSGVASAGSVSNGPIWLGRLLSTIGVAVVFGSLVLIVAAWPEGPEYVLALKFLRTAWLIGLGGTLLYVIALSAAVKGESFGSGISPGSWFDLFDAGWAGRAAVMRIVFVAASGWVVVRPERSIDPTTNMLALGIPALAVITLGLSNTGGPVAPLGVLASIAHVLAMAVWFGGVVLLARVVLAGPGEEDLVHAVHGFSRISTPAIVITVVSGLIQLYRLDGGELFKSGHGRVLLLKTLAAAGMIFVGLTARQLARARLERASELNVRVADRMRRAFGTEAAIGLVVLMLTGWMMTYTPAKIDGGGGGGSGGGWAIERPFADDASGLDLDLFLRPGNAGMNAMRIEVNSPDDGLSGFVVTFTGPDGTVIEQPVAITGAQTAQTTGEGGGIPLTTPGVWTVSISVSTPNGPVQTGATQIEINNADGSAPPTDINVPALPATTTLPVDGPRLTEPVDTSAGTTEG